MIRIFSFVILIIHAQSININFNSGYQFQEEAQLLQRRVVPFYKNEAFEHSEPTDKTKVSDSPSKHTEIEIEPIKIKIEETTVGNGPPDDREYSALRSLIKRLESRRHDSFQVKRPVEDKLSTRLIEIYTVRNRPATTPPVGTMSVGEIHGEIPIPPKKADSPAKVLSENDYYGTLDVIPVFPVTTERRPWLNDIEKCAKGTMRVGKNCYAVVHSYVDNFAAKDYDNTDYV